MLDQKGAQLATVLVAFLDLDEQGFVAISCLLVF